MTLTEAMRCALAIRTGGEVDFTPILHEDRLFVDLGPYAEAEHQPAASIGRVKMGGSDYVAEALGTSGATIEKLELASRIGKTCRFHRLRTISDECREDAEFLLTTPDGKTLPLCAKHAEELRRRHDNSSADQPRADGSYGWPTSEDIDFSDVGGESPIGLPTIQPSETVRIEEPPAFEEAAFEEGASGGAGAGSTFETLESPSISESPSAPIESTPIDIPQFETPSMSSVDSSFDSSSSSDSGSSSSDSGGSSFDSGSSSSDGN